MKENNDREKQEAMSAMQNLCSKTEKCRRDIHDKLKLKKLSESDILAILDQLTEEGFIDEMRYSSFFVRDKFRFNHWGRIKIRHAMQVKKIPEEIIENALDSIDEEEYFSVLKEDLKKKNASIKEDDPFKKKGKLFRFAAQRGFEPDLIYKAMESVLS